GSTAGRPGRDPLPVSRRLFRSPFRPSDCRSAASPIARGPSRGPWQRHLRNRYRGQDGVAMAVRRPFTRQQRVTIVNGMLACVLMLVVLQLWLLTATMNAYLGGDASIIWPAALASV